MQNVEIILHNFKRNRRVLENELIKKLHARIFLKHVSKANDISALRYAIIKL